jgi:hypothetical protein
MGYMAHKIGMEVSEEKPKELLVNGEKVDINEKEIQQNVSKMIN